MKNYFSRWMLFVTMLILCSISCSKSHPASDFLLTFSLAETIKQMNVQEIEPSSGEASSTMSSGDSIPHRHAFTEELIIKGSMPDKFDERGFLTKLQEKITQNAVDSKLKVYGGGSSGDGFHMNYYNADREGGIDVIGVRTEKNKYKVWCIVRELAVNR